MVYSATKAASGDDQPTKYYYPMNIVIHSLNKQAGRWDYINISILPRQAKMKRISISELARQLFSPVILRRSSVQIRFFSSSSRPETTPAFVGHQSRRAKMLHIRLCVWPLPGDIPLSQSPLQTFKLAYPSIIPREDCVISHKRVVQRMMLSSLSRYLCFQIIFKDEHNSSVIR